MTKVVTEQFAYLDKDIQFTINEKPEIVHFDTSGVAEVNDEWVEYLRGHGIKPLSEAKPFSWEDITPENKVAMLKTLPFTQLQEVAKEVAAVANKEQHEWIYLKQLALIEWICATEQEIESKQAHTTTTEDVAEKPKRKRTPKE